MLTVDPKTGCSWITERNGVAETVWTDGTTSDRSSRPPGLMQSGRLVARSGQQVQAEVVPDAALKPIQGCPAPAGAELVAVTTLKVRSMQGG